MVAMTNAGPTDREVMENRMDLEMMQRPHLWGCWPVLPIKKIGWTPKMEGGLGFLLAGGGPVLYKGTIYDLTEKELSDFETTKYPTFESLLADGWVVD